MRVCMHVRACMCVRACACVSLQQRAAARSASPEESNRFSTTASCPACGEKAWGHVAGTPERLVDGISRGSSIQTVEEVPHRERAKSEQAV